MDDGFQMRIVVVEHMAAGAVDESRIHDVEAFASTHQAGLLRSRKRRQRRNGVIDRLMPGAAHRHAHIVVQRTYAFLAHVGGQVFITCIDDVAGEGAGDVVCGSRGRCGCFPCLRQPRDSGCGNRSGGTCFEEMTAIVVTHMQDSDLVVV